MDTLDILDRTLPLDVSALTLLCWTLFRTLLLDTLSGHSCLPLSCQDTLANQTKLSKRAFSTRLSPKVTIQASKTSVFQNKRFPRDVSPKVTIQASKTSVLHETSTRLSPKVGEVTSQASKTSVLHETFTKSDKPSFQNEHFPRDFHFGDNPSFQNERFPRDVSPKVTTQASKTSLLVSEWCFRGVESRCSIGICNAECLLRSSLLREVSCKTLVL